MKRSIIALAALMLGAAGLMQARSPKRGVGWDEKTRHITDGAISKMAPGISWFYTWGATPKGDASLIDAPDGGMEFAPMCWNGGFNEAALRSWLTAHPSTRYLLGFNEPNFSAQANMTPASAAEAWPRVEKVAEDFDLILVAPALNFTGEKVGGRVWSPYEWLDEFIRCYKEQNGGRQPRLDCLALHCYMNWAGAFGWFATEYFYSDPFTPGNSAYGRYRNLTAYLEEFKEANGHFPRMMMTEFCAWEGDKDGYKSSVESQIDQMTQKVQRMELSDLVEGYAWFMANPSEAPTQYPYNSLFTGNVAGAGLSEQGMVYTYMSSFDTEVWHAAGETIAASDYVDASTDSQQAKVRVNSEQDSGQPLEMLMITGAWTKYQISVDADGDYNFTLRMKSGADTPVWLYVDGKVVEKVTLASTGGEWADRTIESVALKAGQRSVMVYNTGDAMSFNALSFAMSSSGIAGIGADSTGAAVREVYDLRGVRVATGDATLPPGLYIERRGTSAAKLLVR